MIDALQRLVASASGLPITARVAIYNVGTKALRALVADVLDAPCLSPQLVPAGDVRANDWNPNHVAAPELALLEDSIRADGVTMGIVTFPTPTGWEVVDGFHRRKVLTERFGSAWLPVVEIDRGRGDRIASTVRHNRARGKHSVDKMAEQVVRELLAEGWDDGRIATHLGMSVEELLRLKQMAGIARLLAAKEYPRAWERPGGPNPPTE